jgi:cardiolipin synthase
MTLANKITVGRILLVPPIVIGLLEHMTLWVYVLLGICMATDFLDGLAARRRGERTRLGAFLDPKPDKLLLGAVFTTLAYQNQVPMWIFVVIFSRDLLIVLGWSVIYILTGTATIEPRMLGKLTTAVQMVTAFACITKLPQPVPGALLWLTLIVTVASAIDYVIVGEKKLGAWT